MAGEDAAADLASALAGVPDTYEVPEEPQLRERFRIRNDDMAAWAMRKLVEAEAKAAALAATAQVEVDAAQARIAATRAWLEVVTAEPKRSVGYFTGLLDEYARDEREGADRKSFTTPYGRVTTTEVGGGWQTDADAVIAWARVNAPELVQETTTTTFLLAEAKKRRDWEVVDGQVVVKATGETVPGIKVPTKDIKVTVTTTMPEVKR